MPAAWLGTAQQDTPQPAGDESVLLSGEDEVLAMRLLEALDSSHDIVVIASFLLAWRDLVEAVLAASRRGIRVYIMNASEHRLQELDRTDDDLERRRVDEHVEMLNKLIGHTLIRTAPGFHAKALLVDPRDDGPGWLLTSNLAHSALTLNDEVAILLSHSEVRQVFEVLRFGWWEMSDHEAAPGALRSVQPVGHIDPPTLTGGVHALMTSDRGLLDSLERVIRDADQLLLTNYSWSREHPVTAWVAAAADRGADVTIISRAAENTAWSGPVLADLASRGVRVRGTDRMHAKVVVADGHVMVHTMNYGFVPNKASLELGLDAGDGRGATLRAIASHWADHAPWRLAPDGEPLTGETRRVPVDGRTWKEETIGADGGST